MPIVVHKTIAFVVSRAEFFEEYSKLKTEEKNILKRITQMLDFEKSIAAITELYSKAIEKQKPNENSRLYYFDYKGEDAQNIVLELILFFSEFYHKLKIYDSQNSLQSIDEYLLPHKKKFFLEKSHITINSGLIHFTLYLAHIKRIKGLVNNFVVYLDNLILHFCSDINLDNGVSIRIEPAIKDVNGEIHYKINDFDYIFDRNKPSKYRLLRFRQKGFLFLIQ